MSFTDTWVEDPFYTGARTSTEVPRTFHVAIGGHPYCVDTAIAKQNEFFSQSQPYIVRYSFYVGSLGEDTLNPEPAWRESFRSWDDGAGQPHYDLLSTTSTGTLADPFRFRSSKGINVWKEGQFTLLPDTSSIYPTNNTNLFLSTAGTYLYASDGTTLKWSTDAGVTWTASNIQAGETASPVLGTTSDGLTVYAALGPNGIHVTTRGQITSTHYNNLQAQNVGYVKGRLMASLGGSIYNVIQADAVAPTIIITQHGTPGVASNGYRITAVVGTEETLPAAEVVTTTANASLSGSNYNILTWTASGGPVTGYNIYGRTAGSGWLKMTPIPVTGTTWNDDGTATPAGAMPVVDTTIVPALFTHPNIDFSWVGFASGQTAIYAAGFSGDKSEIYGITIKTDGTGLGAPIIAANLPTGEVVTGIKGYLGFVVIGTTQGVRFCQETSSGLTVGALIKTGQPARCFDTHEEFIWFGWENYDNLSTGLGRLDPVTINPGNAPAYASDLMASGQGQVTSIAIMGGIVYFAVAGQGVFAQSPNKAPQGNIDSGLTTMKLQDPKVPLEVDARRLMKDGTHQVLLSVNNGTFTSLGIHSSSTPAPVYPITSARGQTLELRHVLTRGSTDPTYSPTVYESTLFALPAPVSGDSFQVPIRLEREIRLQERGPKLLFDVSGEVQFLRDLRALQTPTLYQEGTSSYQVVVKEVKVLKKKPQEDFAAWEGTVLVTMVTINTPNY